MRIVKPAFLVACFLLCTQLLMAQIRAKEGKGYFNITNIAEPNYLQSIDSSQLTFGDGYIRTLGFSASTINGVFLNSSISVGIGVGIQFTKYKAYQSATTPDSALASGYFDNSHSMTLLPVFADFRYYPNGTRNSLVLILDVGYAPLLKIDNDFDKMSLGGGALVKLGAGYRIPIGETFSFLPSLNFNAQRFGDNTSVGANVGLGFMF